MKLAFAGKGGAGKTSAAAWSADYLARCGHDVLLIDADTALSLGAASGLDPALLPVPLALREDLIRERIGSGLISLTPEVSDLPEQLAVKLPDSSAPLIGQTKKRGNKQLLVMGSIASAGGGCACEANSLLKALLAHLVYDCKQYIIVDLEAGVEHLGRGTVTGVDALIIVSEPSLRSLGTAASISELAQGFELKRQALLLNRCRAKIKLPDINPLPTLQITIPVLSGLDERMLHSGSVLDLPEQDTVDTAIKKLLSLLNS